MNLRNRLLDVHKKFINITKNIANCIFQLFYYKQECQKSYCSTVLNIIRDTKSALTYMYSKLGLTRTDRCIFSANWLELILSNVLQKKTSDGLFFTDMLAAQ